MGFQKTDSFASVFRFCSVEIEHLQPPCERVPCALSTSKMHLRRNARPRSTAYSAPRLPAKFKRSFAEKRKSAKKGIKYKDAGKRKWRKG